MSHQIYLTEGIILKKKDYGEADRLFWIYTEKFGMIMAVSRSVRLEKSKLRYGLDLFSLSELAVIVSGEFWRIVDSKDILTAKSGPGLKTFSGASSLLLRMIKGQEKNIFIWQKLRDFHEYLFKYNNTKFDLSDSEIEFTAKVLRELGYISVLPETKRETLTAVNKAIKESML